MNIGILDSISVDVKTLTSNDNGAKQKKFTVKIGTWNTIA